MPARIRPEQPPTFELRYRDIYIFVMHVGTMNRGNLRRRAAGLKKTRQVAADIARREKRNNEAQG